MDGGWAQAAAAAYKSRGGSWRLGDAPRMGAGGGGRAQAAPHRTGEGGGGRAQALPHGRRRWQTGTSGGGREQAAADGRRWRRTSAGGTWAPVGTRRACPCPMGMVTGIGFCPIGFSGMGWAQAHGSRVGHGITLPVPDLTHCHP